MSRRPAPFRHLVLTVLLAAGLAPPARPQPPAGPLPEGALLRLGSLQFRSPEQPKVVALSPDGRLVAASTGAYDVRLWDERGEPRAAWLADAPVRLLRFSPDGKLLVTVSRRSIQVWDVPAGGEPGVGADEAGAPAGQRKPRASITPAPEYGSVVFSPDGKLLAVGRYAAGIDLYTAHDGKKVRTVDDPATGALGLAFTPDGRQLVSGGYAGTISLWGVENGEKVRQWDSENILVVGAAVSPDGKKLVTSGSGQVLCLWDLPGGTLARRRDLGDTQTNFVAFSADGAAVIADGGDEDVLRWDVATGKDTVLWHDDRYPIQQLAVSADGGLAAVCSAGGPHLVRLIDLAAGREANAGPGHTTPVTTVAYSPDGRLIASAAPLRGDESVIVWDATAGRPLRTVVHEDSGGAGRLAFSPDGKLLASAGKFASGGLQVWEAATGKAVATLAAEGRAFTGLAFSPDGRFLAASTEQTVRGAPGGRARLWDTSTWKPAWNKSGQGLLGAAGELAFTPDGKELLVGTGGQVNALDAATAQPRRIVASVGPVTSLAVTPDQWLLVSGDSRGTLSITEAVSGEHVFAKNAPGVREQKIALTPDGRVVASCGNDGQVHLWSVPDGRLLKSFRGDTMGGVRALAFSPDGRRLVSGGQDTTSVVWDVAPVLRDLPDGPRAARVEPEELERAWTNLRNPGMQNVYHGIGVLASARDQTPALLKEKLKVGRLGPDEIRKLIADLDSSNFRTRETARIELTRQGKQILPALDDALKADATLELRLRIEKLREALDSVEAKRFLWQQLRAVHVLQQIGTPQARALLESLARESERLDVARQAQQALRYLQGRGTR